MKLEKIDIRNIEIDKEQPRKKFENIDQLISAIIKEGLLEPLKLIKQKDNKYLLIDGERRLRALKFIVERDGDFDKRINCIILPKSHNNLITQLVTDIHKEKLSYLEEANAFDKLIQMGLDINDIKGRIGKDRSYVVRRLKLLAFNSVTQKKIDEGKIPFSAMANINVEDIKKKEDIIVSRIEEENASSERIIEIIQEENYRYEERINSFLNRIQRFSEDITRFHNSIKEDIQKADILNPVGLKIEEAMRDLEKLKNNLYKIDIVKEKIGIIEDKVNKLYKKFPKKTIITKEIY